MKYCPPIVALIFLSSCYSYTIFPKGYRTYAHNGDKQLAFVTNPELKKENRILRESGIFTLTSDSVNENCLKIYLHPLQRRISCGQPIIGSIFTLGQLPVYMPDRYRYTFEVISRKDTVVKDFELLIAQRIWFWDMFVLNKRFSEKAGKAVLANYYGARSTL